MEIPRNTSYLSLWQVKCQSDWRPASNKPCCSNNSFRPGFQYVEYKHISTLLKLCCLLIPVSCLGGTSCIVLFPLTVVFGCINLQEEIVDETDEFIDVHNKYAYIILMLSIA